MSRPIQGAAVVGATAAPFRIAIGEDSPPLRAGEMAAAMSELLNQAVG